MDCKTCDQNYLRKIFLNCLEKSSSTEEGLAKFDRICEQSNDPRNPLSIAISVNKNTCDECKKYMKYYKDII